MSRPVGSKNKSKSEIITDGYAEAFTGAGTRRDRSSGTRIKSAQLFDNQTLTDMYIGDGMARRIIDIPAEEMTRAGIDIDDMEDDELEDKIESKLDDLDAMKHHNDALRWSRLFGGCIMVYGLNDGGTLDVPLNEMAIKDVEFIRTYDRWQATIQTRYNDPESVNYGKPETWLISPSTGGNSYLVHESRMSMFDGDAVPDFTRQQNQGWGASTLQSCADQLTRLGMSHQWANMLLERSQQAVHKIPGLSNTLRQPNGESMMKKRVDVVDMVRGILNTIVIDGEEDYVVTSQSMTGIPDVLDRFAEAVSAVTGIPVTVLMGRSPGGMSATGKSDLDNWYARVMSMQNDQLKKPLTKLVKYIKIALTGNSDIDFSICFNPLAVMSATEEATINKIKADKNKAQSEADTNYANIGSIVPNEIRKNIADDYKLAEDDELTPAEVAAAVAAQTPTGAVQ
jgi:phage-related protein (TIGR01555 family)